VRRFHVFGSELVHGAHCSTDYPEKRIAKPGEACQKARLVANPSDSVTCKPLEVQVGDKGIERAIKHLKRKMAAEGILRELKRRRHYMKPSVKRRKKMSEAARRRRKRLRTDDMPRGGMGGGGGGGGGSGGGGPSL
jgi:small subunit ribosomal protein S21